MTAEATSSHRGMRDERRRARESALQVLYQWEVGRISVEQAVDTVLTRQWPDAAPAPTSLRAFAERLATETVSRLEAIDLLIAETAERWRPERMAIIDRLILRLATCELVRGAEPTAAVVINEALELAKRFSTDDSARFINGVLDAIRKKLDR